MRGILSMPRLTHPALGDPRTDHPGEEFDCPACRSALLGAFRDDVPGPGRPAPRPLFFPGDDDLEECPDPELISRAVIHDVASGVRPADGRSGTWYASCSCGWKQEGRYVDRPPARLTREDAALLADKWMIWHIDHPQGDDHR